MLTRRLTKDMPHYIKLSMALVKLRDIVEERLF